MEAFAPNVLAFYLISAVAIILAILAVTTANLVRAALALAFGFFSLAGIFWLLGSPFVAVLQLVVNAGAIPIVTIFIVMMTQSRFSQLRNPLFAAVALLVAIPLLIAAFSFFPSPATTALTQTTPLTVEALGVELLSQRGAEVTLSSGETMTVQAGTILAFEVTAIILLVAFVGSIILARRESLILKLESGSKPAAEGKAADADA